MIDDDDDVSTLTTVTPSVIETPEPSTINTCTYTM
jgi:hypothetical protein